MKVFSRHTLRLLLVVTVFGVAVSAAPALAQEVNVPTIRIGSAAANFAAGTVTADIDGDGRREVISCSNGMPSAVSFGDETLRTMWIGPDVNCQSVAAGDIDADGDVDIVAATVEAPPRLLVFDPRSYGVPWMSSNIAGASSNPVEIAIANIDAEPGLEIVVAKSSETIVHDARTLAMEWSIGFGGSRMRIGDVDGDGVSDVVLAGNTGWVLDGQARTTKFGYVGGFGSYMSVGDVDKDGKAEIVGVMGAYGGAYGGTITVLDCDTFNKSSFAVSDSIYSVTIGDADNNGSNEIVTGSYNLVTGYKPDGSPAWNLTFSGVYDCRGVNVADLTGDGLSEFFGVNRSNRLFVASVPESRVLVSHVEWKGPFSSAVADLDGDGRNELIVASRTIGLYTNGGGVIEIVDAITGARKARFTHSASILRLAVGQLDSDAALEIVAVTDSSYGSIAIWDGVTHQVQASIPGSYDAYFTSALAVTNVDGDPVDEILVGQSDYKLLVLNGASGVIQAAVAMTSSPVEIVVTDLDGNGTKDLLVSAGYSGVYAVSTTSWTLTGTAAPSGYYTAAVAVADGRVFHGSTDGALKTYTGTTLVPGWGCTATELGLGSYVDIAATNVGLLAVSTKGTARLVNRLADSCKVSPTFSLATGAVERLGVADATKDGRPDLLVDTAGGTELFMLALSTEALGDVDGDTIIGMADAEKLADFVGGLPGLSPTGDVNGDQRISAEDVFRLVSHYADQGAALEP